MGTEKDVRMERIHLAHKQALKITVIYLLLGSFWIIFSDMIAEQIVAEHYNMMLVSMTKGILYVVATAILLYGLIYYALKKLTYTETKLKKSETLLRTVFNQAPIGIAISETNTTKYVKDEIFPSINPMLEKITGRTKFELRSIGWGAITPTEDLQEEIELNSKMLKGEINSYRKEKRYLKPDGTVGWVSKTVVPFFLDGDSKKYNLFLIEDINESKIVERALAESERSKSVLLSNLLGTAYRCKFDTLTMQFVSDGCFDLTGYRPECFGSLSYMDLIAEEYKNRVRQELAKMLEQRMPFRYEYELITSAGERKWVLDIGRGIYDEFGNVEAFEGIIIDITERKQHEIKLKFLSERDALTGLYNRRFFEEFLEQESKFGREIKRAVILLDLNRINFFNMIYGYGYSENLIKEITMQLSYLCGGECRLFQISFERIAFYLKNYGEKNKLIAFCDEVLNLLEKMQVRQSLDCNIGIFEIDNCELTSDILKNVSIAAAKSAENQETYYYFFEDKLKEELARNAIIKEELINAASDSDNESVFLLYQPIFDAKTGKIHAFEALARFASKKLGVISPSEFISIAEETQMIIPIGRRILCMACYFIKELEMFGYGNVVISVNVSAVQMLRSDFVNDVRNIIEETEINPYMLALEITESTLLTSYESVNKAIGKLKGLGIKFAIDDFGVGYSSLARERELNVDSIKLDKYFADDLLTHKENEIIVGDLISMMHKFGHTVVAEGVEYEKQKDYLIRCDCDYLQGYFFSKPVTVERALELLKEGN